MPMLAVRIISLLGVVVMLAIIVFGFASGDFSAEGADILRLPWGKVTLVDLYVGLALFGIWVAYRERSWLRRGLWWVLLMVLGNLAAALYLAWAAFNSRDSGELLLGPAR